MNAFEPLQKCRKKAEWFLFNQIRTQNRVQNHAHKAFRQKTPVNLSSLACSTENIKDFHSEIVANFQNFL
ncbi:MAG TPA: hypothetical protein DCO78_08405 [Chitinophagaceae bacterium]|nr:hypothetical protein [Chitinophagaceae bacterium]